MLEGNNKQLFYLLEKYDSKVTELQEDIDIKDLKIRYELFHLLTYVEREYES